MDGICIFCRGATIILLLLQSYLDTISWEWLFKKYWKEVVSYSFIVLNLFLKAFWFGQSGSSSWNIISIFLVIVRAIMDLLLFRVTWIYFLESSFCKNYWKKVVFSHLMWWIQSQSILENWQRESFLKIHSFFCICHSLTMILLLFKKYLEIIFCLRAIWTTEESGIPHF